MAFHLLWSYQVLVWHHRHQVFTSCSASQSRPLPFFPPGCTFSMVTTIACCPCHQERVTSTLAVGRVAKFARRWLPMLFCCSTTHCGFPPNADDLLSVRSCCLSCQRVTCSTIPSSRPDTASFRSCLIVATGFPGHAGGCHLRKKPCVVLIFPPFGSSCGGTCLVALDGL